METRSEDVQSLRKARRVKISRIAIVVIGIFAVAASGATCTYQHCSNRLDAFAFIANYVALGLGVVLLIVNLVVVGRCILLTNVWRKIDMVFHGLMAALLIFAFLFMIYRVATVKGEGAGSTAQRVAAIILTLLATVPCSYIEDDHRKQLGVHSRYDKAQVSEGSVA